MNFSRFVQDRLLGTEWKHEPGSVWMLEIDRLNPNAPPFWKEFFYTHWRERSFFRGKAFRKDSYKEQAMEIIGNRLPAKLHTVDEWDESCHSVLWWRLPVTEPPWVGTPLDSDWEPGYYTHWTPIILPLEIYAQLLGKAK